MGEVEAQAVRRDQRAFLLHVFAEHLAKRRMHEVRRRVIEPDGLAALVVDDRVDGVPDIELALFDRPVVNDRVAAFLCVHDLEQLAGLGQDAGVADLAAAFGIERRR